MRSFRINYNISRIWYDFLVASFSLFIALLLNFIYQGKTDSLNLVFAPFLLLLMNYLLGIYSRFKVAAWPLKVTLLTTNLFVISFVFSFFSSKLVVFVWLCFVWLPLILPRFLLNLNTRVKTNFISKTLAGRGPVVVVGGAGYIGTYVVDLLLKANYQVRVLDRFLYDKNSINEFITNPNFEYIEGDATDILKLVTAVNGASAVIHLAGLVGDPACSVDPSFTRHANVIATRMVKEIAISCKVNRFIFASSCSVYGVNENEVNEESELNPVSLYAETKIDSEKELLLCPDDTFNATVLRFATVFGHSRRPRFDLVANLFAAQAMVDGKITISGGDQWRPFVHVKDLARAILMVLQADEEKVRGQIFNVGDGRLNMTIGQLGALVHKISNRYRPVDLIETPWSGDRRNYLVSFEKIKKVLGFSSETLMEEGLTEICSNFNTNFYGNYKEPKYSNVLITKQAAELFYDPIHTARLYRPMSELYAEK